MPVIMNLKPPKELHRDSGCHPSLPGIGLFAVSTHLVPGVVMALSNFNLCLPGDSKRQTEYEYGKNQETSSANCAIVPN